MINEKNCIVSGYAKYIDATNHTWYKLFAGNVPAITSCPYCGKNALIDHIIRAPEE